MPPARGFPADFRGFPADFPRISGGCLGAAARHDRLLHRNHRAERRRIDMVEIPRLAAAHRNPDRAQSRAALNPAQVFAANRSMPLAVLAPRP